MVLTIFGGEIEPDTKKTVQRKFLHIVCVIVAILAAGCSRKHLPETTPITVENKPVVKKPVRTAVPKVITVNDSAAQKSADGRLFYDLEGHRYWRNYNDGKYYLFNKSMYGNDAFRPH